MFALSAWTQLAVFAKDNCYFNEYHFLFVSEHSPDMLDEILL